MREQVLGEDYNRRATEKEIQAMRELVERAMREGAFGLSTGLEYDVGRASSTEEVIELARIAARYGGIYMTHMRDEEEGMFAAVAEAIRIGREAASARSDFAHQDGKPKRLGQVARSYSGHKPRQEVGPGHHGRLLPVYGMGFDDLDTGSEPPARRPGGGRNRVDATWAGRTRC